MSEDVATLLTRYEWVEHPISRVRLKFRRDSTGFYEREGAPGTRLVRDNLLYRVEGHVLHLKFAHARFWTDVSFDLRKGRGEEGTRIGQWELFLSRDPYAWMIEEHETESVVLFSDTGAALLG